MPAMKRYEKYKDSGVEWIGEIPEHWEMSKLKYLLKPIKGALKPGPFGSDLKNSDVSPNGIYKVYTQRNVIENDFELGEDFVSDEKFRELRAFEIYANDILVTTRGTIGRAALFTKGLPKGILHPCLIRLGVDQSKALNNWLIIYFNGSSYFIDNVKLNSNTTVIDVIYGYTLREILIPIPTLEEQNAISNYLDEKTVKIDSLIANKQRLIELFKEERAAIINQAVTGQLTINNEQLIITKKFKPSGIEWLGDIPEHWEVKKLKYVAKIRDELIGDSNFKIAVENIESGTGKLVNIEEEKNYRGQLSAFKAGDTIFNKLRPYLHKVYYAEKDGGLYGELLIIFTLYKLVPKYLYYRLFSKSFIDIVDSSTQGTKMPRASWNDFINQLFISFPSNKDEQTTIVQYIETETQRIDTTISKIEKEISLLQEYRTALISEVVTGKIKVI